MPDPGLLRSLTLARGDLDRAAERRADDAWLAAAWTSSATRVVVVRRGRAATRRREDGVAELVLVAPEAAPDDGVRVLLAVEDDVAFFALALDEDAPEGDIDGLRWNGLREVGAKLGDRDAGLLVMAVALANWHATHPRCPRCGAATSPTQAGWSRTCPDDASQHFPRSDPAVIVLVTDDADRALLGRRADWPRRAGTPRSPGSSRQGSPPRWPCVREILEEAGVRHRPRPPRLPGIAAVAVPVEPHARLPRAGGGRLGRGAIPTARRSASCAGSPATSCSPARRTASVRIPPPLSIARRLIEHWYGAELPGTWSRP